MKTTGKDFKPIFCTRPNVVKYEELLNITSEPNLKKLSLFVKILINYFKTIIEVKGSSSSPSCVKSCTDVIHLTVLTKRNNVAYVHVYVSVQTAKKKRRCSLHIIYHLQYPLVPSFEESMLKMRVTRSPLTSKGQGVLVTWVSDIYMFVNVNGE